MRKMTIATWVVAACLTVALCPAASAAGGFPVAGRVVNESGQAVADASVSAIEISPQLGWTVTAISAETKTDETGRFAMKLSKAPMMQARYAFAFAARHPDYGMAWTITYHLDYMGESLTDFTLTMPKKGSIKGKVTDAEGNPAPGAIVVPCLSLEAAGPSPIELFVPPCERLLRATTAADGTFVLDGLPENAKAMLRVSHPDFAITVSGSEPSSGPGGLGGTIQVGESNIEVKLEPGATIEGTVTFEGTDRPTVGALVEAAMAVSRPEKQVLGVMEAKTDQEGNYTIRGVPEGTYGLQVTYPDWTAPVKQAIVAEKGARVTGADFVLGKGVLVTGRFTMAGTGEPVNDGYLMMQVAPGLLSGYSLIQPVKTEQDGTFAFRQPPGMLNIYAYTESSGYVPQEESLRELFLVAGQDQTDVTFKVTPWISFKGKVLGPNGSPLAGAWVYATETPHQTAETAEDGTFKLALVGWQPAEYRFIKLEARHPDMPGHRGLFATPFQSESDAEGEIELKQTATIAGRVVDGSGRPVKSANVIALATFRTGRFGTASMDKAAVSDESGQYEMEEVASGVAYQIQATADGRGQDMEQNVALKEGEKYTVRDLVLEVADMSIEGTVTDADGQPVAGVQIGANGPSTGHRSTSTDEKGRYRLENLVDEQIQIWAYSQRPDGLSQGRATAMAGDENADIILGETQVSPEQREERRLVDKGAPELDVAEWVNCEPVTLASLRGKTVVLAFWDLTDGASTDLVALLNDLRGKHPDIEIVSVHGSNAESDEIKQFISDSSIAYRVALDKPADKHKGATFEKYRVRKPPAVFIIDAEGKLRYQDIPLPAVEQALKTMLGGQQQ